MKVIEFGSEQYENFEPSSHWMIFCTSAEANEERYLKRVAAWRAQISKLGLTGELFCFHDGQISKKLLTSEHDSIAFITFDRPLGRLSVWEIPGWKRSLWTAMVTAEKFRYELCTHIESDVIICRGKKFDELCHIDGLTSLPFCPQYGMPETAAMILNDQRLRKDIIKFYDDGNNLYSNVSFEGDEFYKLISPYYVCFGLSNRLEKEPFNFRYDVITQASPDLVRRCSEFQREPSWPESFAHAIGALNRAYYDQKKNEEAASFRSRK